MKTTNLAMLYVYSFLLGINLGGEIPVLPGLMADHFGRKHFGVIYGVAFLMLTIGTAIGPIYGGWIFDLTGSYQASFLTSIILSFITSIMVSLSGRPKGS
jgi:MFS family permease